MPLQIIRQSIAAVVCDAVVNPTNTAMIPTGGADAAIHEAAGARLAKACAKLAPLGVGEVAITPAFSLPCRYVIHTVGPVWVDGTRGECEALKACYHRVLSAAVEKKCKSVALPLIASGAQGFPKDRVLKIAVSAVEKLLQEVELTVYLVVFDKTSYEFSRTLFRDVTDYLTANLKPHRALRPFGDIVGCDLKGRSHHKRGEEFSMRSVPLESKRQRIEGAVTPEALRKRLKTVSSNSFAVTLLRLIDEKGMTDVECYKRANVDKKIFSKIRCKDGYQPSKRTAVAFAIALRLTLDQTQDLLATAGLALSNSSEFDVIVGYFIENEEYNIHAINEALFEFDQVLLGC